MQQSPPPELALQVVNSLPRPGLIKRLLVACYDLLLLFGVILVASVPFLLIPAAIETTMVVRVIKLLYLVGVVFCFYAWFWTHGGQTLGMRVWNLYLVNAQGKFIDWPRAALRFALSLVSVGALGLGFTWILLHRQRRTWHDIGSGTHIVQIKPK